MKTFLFTAAIILAASFASGQSLSPLNNECGKKCSGQYTITNQTLKPLVVTVTPYQFTFNAEGQAEFRNPDPTVDIKMNTMSALLQPQEVFTFDYHIKCAEMPCAIAFANEMTMDKIKEGVGLKIVLSEAVYQCPKQKGCRLSVLPPGGVK